MREGGISHHKLSIKLISSLITLLTTIRFGNGEISVIGREGLSHSDSSSTSTFEFRCQVSI